MYFHVFSRKVCLNNSVLEGYRLTVFKATLALTMSAQKHEITVPFFDKKYKRDRNVTSIFFAQKRKKSLCKNIKNKVKLPGNCAEL